MVTAAELAAPDSEIISDTDGPGHKLEFKN